MTARLLFVCGSMNQTTQMHQIASELPEYDHCFSPYYADGTLEVLRKLHLIEFTVAGNRSARRAQDYIEQHGLKLDRGGRAGSYDLVFTCSDLIVPRNLRSKTVILVQEGMTDPENFLYRLVRRFPRVLPRWLASTSTTGLSDCYDRFCVASEGYRDLFVRKGVRREKIVVTGIPNFDNCKRFMKNDFPYRHFVLVCTSDARETFKRDNRKRFVEKAVRIAHGRPLLFKLHPNENVARATREIAAWAPGAMVFHEGSAEDMIANCDVLITQYSSTAFVGLALGKEVHSAFDLQELWRLLPVQHVVAARNIAHVARQLLEERSPLAARKQWRAV